jgi:hypothetical protein
MKKKTTLVLFIAIYAVSLIAGFSFAGFRRAEAGTPTPDGARQTNWVLVRVDDMSLAKPQLVSIWGMFLSFTPGPQVFFKPIYSPDITSAPALKLAGLFNVNADRTISTDFIQELDRLNIQRAGMVIIDDTGFQSFTSWFNSTPVAAQANLLVPATGWSPILRESPEIQSYRRICASLQAPASPRSQGLAWRAMVPNHILPQPDLKSLTDLWEKIIASNIQAHCEVIAY